MRTRSPPGLFTRARPPSAAPTRPKLRQRLRLTRNHELRRARSPPRPEIRPSHATIHSRTAATGSATGRHSAVAGTGATMARLRQGHHREAAVSNDRRRRPRPRRSRPANADQASGANPKARPHVAPGEHQTRPQQGAVRTFHTGPQTTAIDRPTPVRTSIGYHSTNGSSAFRGTLGKRDANTGESAKQFGRHAGPTATPVREQEKHRFAQRPAAPTTTPASSTALGHRAQTRAESGPIPYDPRHRSTNAERVDARALPHRPVPRRAAPRARAWARNASRVFPESHPRQRRRERERNSGCPRTLRGSSRITCCASCRSPRNADTAARRGDTVSGHGRGLGQQGTRRFDQ